ncbi:MAG: hypothetical protein BAA01_00045 [Bacillus thermozeamaize]|uniref:Uncharacterized protein n=1 Tax=Bacillus thermozeamaize TaxID=230954 RepID=A0A1Y3PRG5_9BACI|nr:MAG: hypothetical protein BAA01_00045 [Bacillus thermozeamaize]
MIESWLGITALVAIFIITLVCAMRWADIRHVLLVAFLVRAALALIHYYIFPLPDSSADAVNFERVAWEWSREPLGLQFVGNYSYFISWLIALFYRFTGRSPLLAQSLSVLFGTATVAAGWYLARELWGRRAAKKAAWAMTFIPTLLLYSAIIMREAYIWFFFVLGLIGVARWHKTGRTGPMVLAVLGFSGATLFHGGMAVAAMAFCALVAIEALHRLLKGFSKSRVSAVALFWLFVSVLPFVVFVSGAVSLPKLGTFERLLDAQNLLRMMAIAARDGAAYPSFAVPTSTTELLWKTPIRLAYFLFAPFPWDIRAPQHLIGLIDGAIYLVVALTLWRKWSVVVSNKTALRVMIIVIAVLFVFSFGVGNFGTGIRHRAKLVVALLACVAPFIPKIRVRTPGVIRRNAMVAASVIAGRDVRAT